jgi:hypothetical protein
MEDTKPTVICPVCSKEVINLGSHMKAHTPTETEKGVEGVPETKVSKKSILKNTLGREVPEADYFFKGTVPSGFAKTCGKPVGREELVDVFNKTFNPADNFLFYKVEDKEVYIVIVPIKCSTTISESNNSLEGDFQKHAISFLNEGSVNLDTLKMKLGRISKFCKFDDR